MIRGLYFRKLRLEECTVPSIATLRLHTASLLQSMRSIEYASPVCCCDQKCFFIVGIQTSGMSIPLSLLLLG